MATISNMVSMGYSASSTSGIKSQISEVQDELRALGKKTDISSEERSKLQKEYQEKLDGLNGELDAAQNASLASIQNNASTLLGTGGTGSNTDNQNGLNFFFSAAGTLNSLTSVNSARIGIENRARTLVSEIKMDKARGVNTSGKEETLANLTANLTVMDSNLGGNIDKALSDESTSSSPNANAKPVISQIKDQLTENQKKVEKEVKETYKPKTEETGETP